MTLFRTIRLWIKQHCPGLYKAIRQATFDTYSRLFARRRQQFTTVETVEVHHDGVSFSIVLDPANGFVDTEIYTHGVYEPDILSVIKKYLPQDGVFVDIGTNIGQHSLFAGQVVGERGAVISFEPIPNLVAQFKKSISLNTPNSQHTVHQVACGDKATTLQLHIQSGNVGGSGFHHEDSNGETLSVKVSPADTYLKPLPRIDFIKIDTEGHELEALRGLTQTLAKHKPVLLIEYSPAFWKEAAKEKSTEFFQILEQNNYTLYDLENGHEKISNPDIWYTTFTKIQTNILCLQNQL